MLRSIYWCIILLRLRIWKLLLFPQISMYTWPRECVFEQWWHIIRIKPNVVRDVLVLTCICLPVGRVTKPIEMSENSTLQIVDMEEEVNCTIFVIDASFKFGFIFWLSTEYLYWAFLYLRLSSVCLLSMSCGFMCVIKWGVLSTKCSSVSVTKRE